MLGTKRYKFVKNRLNVPFTIDNFPFQGDGEDKKEYTVKRVITDPDIGDLPGQGGDPLGIIVDVIPKNYNVLLFNGSIMRPSMKPAGYNITPYNNIDNETSPDSDEFEVSYLLGEDNTLRVRTDNVDLPFMVGDIVTMTVIIGYRDYADDVMNR